MANEKQSEPANKAQGYKVLAVIVGIIVLIILVSFVIPKSNIDTTTFTPTGNAPTTSNEPAASPSEKLTISNTSFTSQGSYVRVIGEIKNNDSIKHTATLKATFYDANGKIVGTASGVVNEIAPGETKTIELMTADDVSTYTTLKVAVDTLI